jgi:hypothetical protein
MRVAGRKPRSTAIAVALVCLTAMLFASCASDQRAANGEPCDALTEEGEGGGTFFIPYGRSWTPPLMKSLFIFKRKREPSDRLPSGDCGISAAIELASDPDSSSSPGKALVEESRLAVSRLPEGRRLFVVPTSRGGVCAIVTEPGASYSCGGGSDMPGVGYSNPTRGKPYLYGVLPNEVVAITVRTGEQSVRVPVHENAFYFQLDDEVRLARVGLIAAYRDGTEQRIG